MLLRVGHQTEDVSELEIRSLHFMVLQHQKCPEQATPFSDREWDLLHALLVDFIRKRGDQKRLDAEINSKVRAEKERLDAVYQTRK